ncbi:MAG: TRAP transporter small permease [Defluviicoccus sp.]|nr:TRAP transporter small permease [Defluviicoccus sp.]
MAEPGEGGSRPTDPVGRLLYAIARWLAILGGAILAAMALLTTVSIVGRAAFSAPVRGDFELVAIGTGIAVFAFLPWCQLTRGNVLVDFFMDRAPVRAKALCDALGGVLYVSLGALLTWRMVFGGIDMHRYAELSLTLNFPRWTTFPVSVALMGFLIAVTAYTVWRSLREMRAGRFLDDGDG